MITALLLCFVAVEAYYWLIYLPRMWRTPGMSREIDDVRLYLDTVRKLRRAPHENGDDR